MLILDAYFLPSRVSTIAIFIALFYFRFKKSITKYPQKTVVATVILIFCLSISLLNSYGDKLYIIGKNKNASLYRVLGAKTIKLKSKFVTLTVPVIGQVY